MYCRVSDLVTIDEVLCSWMVFSLRIGGLVVTCLDFVKLCWVEGKAKNRCTLIWKKIIFYGSKQKLYSEKEIRRKSTY